MTSALDEEIVSRVGENWDENRAPILLAALGSRLSDRAKSELRANIGTLADYISGHLPQIRLVRIPERDTAAAPRDKVDVLTDEQVAGLYRPKPPGERADRKMFHPNVWRAFSTLMKPGYHRYLVIREGEEPRLLDVPEASVAPNDAKNISAVPDVSSLFGGARFSAVQSAVISWAGEHGIDVSRLEVSAPDGRKDGGLPASSQDGRETSLLSEALEMLTPSELARISIPGDVLLSIVRRLR